MKILVFSDTHGKSDKMYEIISRSRASCDLVVHLGDCWRDIDEIRNDFPQIAFLGVRGNCDFFASEQYPKSHCITLDGHTFYMVHGHMQAIKTHGFSLLTAEAKRLSADIALYGHTHIGMHKEVNGVTVFNPGSLTNPRDYSGGSYGVITIDKGICKFEICQINQGE